MIGKDSPFGPEINFNQGFARDYVQTANTYWLYEYHVDGFRYDEVTDLYDGPTGVKYAKIAREALDATSLKVQCEKWQELFGSKFPDAPEEP